MSTIALALSLAACSSGGSEGEVTINDPNPPIDPGGPRVSMAGMWQMTDVEIVGVSDPSAAPVDGAVVELSDTALVALGGDPMDRATLERDLGVSLASYVNQVDSSTLTFGYSMVDHGVSLEVGMAGVAVDGDHVAVESVSRIQLAPGVDPWEIRTRYTLARQAVPLQIARADDVPSRTGAEKFFGWPVGTLAELRDAVR